MQSLHKKLLKEVASDKGPQLKPLGEGAKLTPGDILEFLELSNTHRKSSKSFVLVTDKVTYDDVPDKITVVPTLQEAVDIIEMEEIERDLGL